MKKYHQYNISLKWTGNKGKGTSGYKDYERDYSIFSENKVKISCSADPAFRGDKTKYNPEELLVASISSCHMLWFLHLCAVEGIVVVDYSDSARGVMDEREDGSGTFSEVTLQPKVTVTDVSMMDKANDLHKSANKMCFIANSLNFPVYHKPEAKVQ